ncbi:MAG TPA: SGNH/GDSL hydrolase family protein, partial [Gemmatimonadaceae bacterium]
PQLDCPSHRRAQMRTPLITLAAVAAVGTLGAGSVSAQQPGRWFATWAPSPLATAPRPMNPDSADRVPTYSNRTLRQILRTSIGGNRVRVHFTNEYGDRAIFIGAAHIAIRDTGASIRAGSDRAITFGGRTSLVLRRSAVIVSDPIDLPVPPLADLAISIFVSDSSRASTYHAVALQTNYVSSPGDHSADVSMHADTVFRQWVWLNGVDVTSASATGTIVAFGNSITDGNGSKADSNSRWPNVLARRLLASKEPVKAVVDAGISGNGVLSQIAGPSALVRFDRDVLMQAGVTHVIVLEAINDLNRSGAAPGSRDSVSARDIIYGYQQLIARAHERGVVIIGATLTPMGNMGRPFTAAANAQRMAINEWIRTSGAFDGVIDFDKVTRDPEHPDSFLPAYDSGDHLHPSGAGYVAMGESIDLTLFRKTLTPRRP